MADGVSCLSRWSGCGLASGPAWSSHAEHVSDRNLQYGRDAAWRRDVALEIWVDVERVSVTIRLAGTLDSATADNLISVVAELIADGSLDFDLITPTLCVPDEGGAGALTGLQRLIQSSGGRLVWDGATANRPLSLRGNGVESRSDQAPKIVASAELPG